MHRFLRLFQSTPPRHMKLGFFGIATATATTWSMCHGSNAQQKVGGDVVLAADVGGTNSRFKLVYVPHDAEVVRKQQAPGNVIFERTYANFGHSTFLEVISTFLEDAKAKVPEVPTPVCACVAAAGVVTANQCRLTNIDWVIRGSELQKELGIGKAEIINDFVAQGYGILTLADDEVTYLHDVKPTPGAPIACLGAGTGLGECFLTPGPSGEYQCFPSEGGHAEWAPRGQGSDQTHIKMLEYLKIKFSAWNRISVEKIVSGPGICNIYDYLAYNSPDRVCPVTHKLHMQSGGRNAGIIAKNATPGSLCEEALRIFCASYGAEAGVLGLKFMPFGGIYLTGGVTGKLRNRLLREPEFIESYFDKGRVSPLLKRVPLCIVNIDDMGERGAILKAVLLLKQFKMSGGICHDDHQHLDFVDLIPPRERDLADIRNAALKIAEM